MCNYLTRAELYAISIEVYMKASGNVGPKGPKGICVMPAANRLLECHYYLRNLNQNSSVVGHIDYAHSARLFGLAVELLVQTPPFVMPLIYWGVLNDCFPAVILSLGQ